MSFLCCITCELHIYTLIFNNTVFFFYMLYPTAQQAQTKEGETAIWANQLSHLQKKRADRWPCLSDAAPSTHRLRIEPSFIAQMQQRKVRSPSRLCCLMGLWKHKAGWTEAQILWKEGSLPNMSLVCKAVFLEYQCDIRFTWVYGDHLYSSYLWLGSVWQERVLKGLLHLLLLKFPVLS